jgi:hypothetical protein
MIASYQPRECEICGSSLFSSTTQPSKGDNFMAINKDIFSFHRFRTTIEGYCQQIGWKIREINNQTASLVFTMESGNDQFLYIVRYDNTLEFSCPSGVKFNDFDSIPHALSTFLLQQNAKFKIGFWSIEEISGRQVFSIMHNAEMSLIDVNYFQNVVVAIITKCDEFETSMEKMLRN